LRSALRSLLLFACAAVGFSLVAGATARLVPMPNALGHWAKWKFLEQHRDEFDAVWIGTSHVLRDVDNPSIERRLAEQGIEMAMFNFGIAGMGTYEQDYILHRLLALRPERLRYIFLEGGPIAMGLHPRHIFRSPEDNDTLRSVMWHTPVQTAKVLDQVWILPVSLPKKLDFAFEHLRLLGRHLANYGQGPEIVRGLEGVRIDEPWLVELRGFETCDEVHSEEFAATAEQLGSDAPLGLELPDELATIRDLSGLNVEFYERQYAAAEPLGVTIVHVQIPGSLESNEHPVLHREGVIALLWNFNLPEEYPELFRVAHRWDEEHLNAEGVALFTDLLVERIAALVAEEPRTGGARRP
jgi:hypothetical protein